MRKIIFLFLLLTILTGCRKNYSANVLTVAHTRMNDEKLSNILTEYKNISNHLEYKLYNVDSVELNFKIYNNNKEVIYESGKFEYDNLDSKLFYLTVGTNDNNPYFALIKNDKIIFDKLINFNDIISQPYYLKSVNFGGITNDSTMVKPNEPFTLAYIELSLDSNVNLSKTYSFYSLDNEFKEKIIGEGEYAAVIEVSYKSSKYIEPQQNPLT